MVKDEQGDRYNSGWDGRMKHFFIIYFGNNTYNRIT